MDRRIKNLISSLEKTRSKYWNICANLGLFLNILIKSLNFKKVIEIGTSNGYSGIWMLEALSKTNGHLWTIESHKKERFFLAKSNFAKARFSKGVTQILGHAPEVIPKTPKFFDLAFLDATKIEYPIYFDSLKARIKRGGIIIADNILSHRKDLIPFLEKISKEKNWKTIELDIGSGILIATKIN